MTASTEPRGGLEYGWDPGEDGWGPSMNANLLRLSRVGFHPSVVSKSTTSPPGSPVSGEGYIVPSGAAGAWSGQSGKIAIWDGAAWVYIMPRDGFLVHVADADGLALYDGGAWSADVLRSDRLATAYAHSQATGNPHGTTAAQVGAMETANPVFTGALKQGGTTRITSGGGALLASVQATNLGGAGDRPVAADLTGTLQPKTPDQFRNMIFALAASLKGAANGVAELGADGRVPSEQLPSHPADVVEVANFAALPGTGEAGKIYITLDQNKTWRWSGSGYVEISASLALGETSSTAYRGDRGMIAYDHSQAIGNPHSTTAAQVGAFPWWYATGGTDFDGFSDHGVYSIRGTGWSNGWSGLTGTQDVALIQMHGGTGLKTQIAGDQRFGGLLTRSQMSEFGNAWSSWATIWDSLSLPVGTKGRDVLATTTSAAARTAITAAKAVVMSTKYGDWSLDANTEHGIRQTASGTLTLPAASVTYAGLSYTITATTTLTLTIAGSFCYLDSPNSPSYWYDTATSVAFVMNGGHSSGNRKKIKIYCDGVEWLVKC